MLRRKNWKEKFTVMVVPHSRKVVTSFRFSLSSIYLTAIVLLLLLGTGAVLVYSYQRMRQNMAELAQLRRVNGEQKAQLEALAAEAQTLESSMARLEELDRQLRQIMKLEPQPSGENSAADARVRPAAENNTAVTTLAVSLPPAAKVVSRGKTDAAARLAQQLKQLQAEAASRETSLAVLKDEATDYMAYLEAKPAGWPTGGKITSEYGYRRSPTGSRLEFHDGLDIAAASGSPIVATGNGRVIFAGWQGSYGRLTIIDHGYGYKTAYGHASRVIVQAGQTVKRGQVIAYVGSSGRSTGPHVHYQVLQSGRTVNPTPFLAKPKAVPETGKN